jgi:hypothetical protein
MLRGKLHCYVIPPASLHLDSCQPSACATLTVCSLDCPAAYLGSIGATIYSAVVLKSYIMSLVCSGLQVRGARLRDSQSVMHSRASTIELGAHVDYTCAAGMQYEADACIHLAPVLMSPAQHAAPHVPEHHGSRSQDVLLLCWSAGGGSDVLCDVILPWGGQRGQVHADSVLQGCAQLPVQRAEDLLRGRQQQQQQQEQQEEHSSRPQAGEQHKRKTDPCRQQAEAGSSTDHVYSTVAQPAPSICGMELYTVAAAIVTEQTRSNTNMSLHTLHTHTDCA